MIQKENNQFNLNTEEIQDFHEDSINDMIDKCKISGHISKEEFNIDNREQLNKDELKVYKKLMDSWDILSWLWSLLEIFKQESTLLSKAKKSTTDAFESFKDIWREKAINIAKELMTKWNIPDIETIISVLDKLQYIKTWEDDKEIWLMIEELKKWEESNQKLKFDASNLIWKSIWMLWTSPFNIIQSQMIESIFWNKEWYNEDYLIWYDNKKWNHLIKISDFDEEVKSKPLKDINSKAFLNYFLLLSSGWKLNIIELKTIFWEDKLKELNLFWNDLNTNDEKKLTKKYLIENNLSYILDLIDNDLEYLATLSEKELNIIKDKIPKENIEEIERIQKAIVIIQIEQRIGVVKKYNIKTIDVENIDVETIKDKDIDDLIQLNSTLLDNIEKYLYKESSAKEWQEEEYIEKKLWIQKKERIKDNEEEKYYNISKNELLNKLVNLKDIKEVIFLIKTLHWQQLEDTDLSKDYLINLYINKLVSLDNNIETEQKIQSLLSNLDILESFKICPRANPIINIRKKLLDLKRKKIKETINNLYPGLDNAWEKLNTIINTQLEKAKEWEQYCSISIKKIIIAFDNENYKHKDIPKKLTDEELKKLISWVLEIKKINEEYKLAKIGLEMSEAYKAWDKERLAELLIAKALAEKWLKGYTQSSNFHESTSKEEFSQMRKAIEKWKDPFDIRDEILKQREEDKVNKNTEEEKINELDNIDTKPYYIKIIPESNWDNNTLIVNWKEITWISLKEYNSIIKTNSEWDNIIKNPEAFKNLVDFKEKMNKLNLDFVWKYRNELTTEAKKHAEYSSLNNTDTDLLNPKELHKLLNFVLKIIWIKWDTLSIKWTYAKIIQLNGWWMLSNQTNFNTKLWNIWQKFYDYWYIWKNSFDIENQSNIIDYKNILKQQKKS